MNTQQVQDKQVDEEWIPEIERADAGNRLPVAQQFVKDIGISGSQWRVLVDQLFPTAKTVQAIAMAITYCRARNLDIFKKPVHIVPMYSQAANGGKGGMVETVWPGISEIRTTAARTGQYAGIDEVQYGPIKQRTFEDEIERWVEPEGGGRKEKKRVKVKKTIEYPEYASVVVYKLLGGQPRAFHARVYWSEAYASVGKSEIPNDMWTKRPFGQLDKCVEAAALRKAFPEEVGSDYTAEEMEGRTIEHIPSEVAASAAIAIPAPEQSEPPKPAPRTTEPEQKQPPKPEPKQTTDGPPKPAPRTQPEQKEPEPEQASMQYEDATYDEMPEEQGEDTSDLTDPVEPMDDSEFLQKLDDEMAETSDEASMEQVWANADPMARFEGNDDFQKLATMVYNRHVKRIAQLAARK